MEFQILDPLDSPDWDAALLRGQDHSFFHTSGWARVLAEAYGFRPLYFSSRDQDRTVFLMPFMQTRSPTGVKRGVSLPCSDQCPPHGSESGVLASAIEAAIEYGGKNGWAYIEWRDNGYSINSAVPWVSYYTHDIDLDKSESDLFASLSSANRRNIQKALREGVTVTIKQTLDAVKDFYRLHLMTRDRHGLPPQPFKFFKNVAGEILAKDSGIIVSAQHENKVIAAAVFFSFGNHALYKYGASDLRHQSLRPNNLVIWEALRWYRDRGIRSMSLGRTDLDNEGLRQFKRAWGGTESLLNYFRYDVKQKTYLRRRPEHHKFLMFLLAGSPPALRKAIGRLFYRYAG